MGAKPATTPSAFIDDYASKLYLYVNTSTPSPAAITAAKHTFHSYRERAADTDIDAFWVVTTWWGIPRLFRWAPSTLAKRYFSSDVDIVARSAGLDSLAGIAKVWGPASITQLREVVPLPLVPGTNLLQTLAKIAHAGFPLDQLLQKLPSFFEQRVAEGRQAQREVFRKHNGVRCLIRSDLQQFYSQVVEPLILEAESGDEVIMRSSRITQRKRSASSNNNSDEVGQRKRRGIGHSRAATPRRREPATPSSTPPSVELGRRHGTRLSLLSQSRGDRAYSEDLLTESSLLRSPLSQTSTRNDEAGDTVIDTTEIETNDHPPQFDDDDEPPLPEPHSLEPDLGGSSDNNLSHKSDHLRPPNGDPHLPTEVPHLPQGPSASIAFAPRNTTHLPAPGGPPVDAASSSVSGSMNLLTLQADIAPTFAAGGNPALTWLFSSCHSAVTLRAARDEAFGSYNAAKKAADEVKILVDAAINSSKQKSLDGAIEVATKAVDQVHALWEKMEAQRKQHEDLLAEAADAALDDLYAGIVTTDQSQMQKVVEQRRARLAELRHLDEQGKRCTEALAKTTDALATAREAFDLQCAAVEPTIRLFGAILGSGRGWLDTVMHLGENMDMHFGENDQRGAQSTAGAGKNGSDTTGADSTEGGAAHAESTEA